MLALTGLAAVLLAGCTGEVLEQTEVEQTTARNLTEVFGATPEVECPGDLEARVGAEMTCRVTPAQHPGVYEAYLRVTDVTGDEPNYQIEMSAEPVQ